MTCALELKNLCKSFGRTEIIRGANLAVRPGERVAIIGPNGAGKSTLFDTISGVRAPTSGTVRYEGTEITARSAVWRSRNGMRRTFQRQQPFGWLSVEDNVLAALDYRGGGGGIVADIFALPTRTRRERERRELARAAVASCGLADLAGQPAGRLSIGKVRLLELARAIVDNPKVLLLDEPTSGLEEHETEHFGEIVRDLRDRTGCSVLLVEHDVPFVMSMCDRITVLNLGEVIAEGTPSEISSNDLVRAAYLG